MGIRGDMRTRSNRQTEVKGFIGSGKRDDDTKRASVVFCIDVSGSMNITVNDEKKIRRMDLVNRMIKGFFKKILEDGKVRSKVEVAFVVFAHKILMETEFQPIRYLTEEDFEVEVEKEYRSQETNQPNYTLHTLEGNDQERYLYPSFEICEEDEGTDIGLAVIHCVNKLVERKKKRASKGSYPATLVLGTDGYPELEAVDTLDDLDDEEQQALRAEREKNQEKAIDLVKQHCHTHSGQNNLIIPFVIGVGGDDVDTTVLDDYTGELIAEAFHVRDGNAEGSFALITDILTHSVTNSTSVNKIVSERIAEQINESTEIINNNEMDEYSEEEDEEYSDAEEFFGKDAH